MEEAPRIETVEIEQDRFISLEFSRRWPQYVVEWSVRQRSGDSDFPLAGGTLERLPQPGADAPDSLWEDLRQDALAHARQAAESVSGYAPPVKERRSILNRLLGRE